MKYPELSCTWEECWAFMALMHGLGLSLEAEYLAWLSARSAATS